MRTTKGLTLVEVTVATGVGMFLVTVVYGALQASLFTTKTTSIQGDLDAKAATIVDGIVRELRYASTSKSAPQYGLGGQSITFTPYVGYANGAATLGNPITYAIVTDQSGTTLQRSESGVTQSQVISDLISTTKRAVNSTPDVIGANFCSAGGNMIQVTVVLEKRNYLLNQNVTTADDVMVASSQATVELLNK